MAKFINKNLWQTITKAAETASSPAHVAVAYLGETGAQLLPLPTGSVLVVDASINTVSSGATCPAALEQLRKKGVEIYSVQHLHAKVYAFDTVAFVGSPNVSNHSAKTLIEAALCVNDPKEISAIREFVSELCLTQLSVSDLKELGSHYKKPKRPKLSPKQKLMSTLLMELTNEQGPGRETQVQPPKAVWEHFFGVKLTGALPVLTLINKGVTPNVTKNRKISKHHHIYTIEIEDAEPQAILEMRRVAPDTYAYRIHRPTDSGFNKIKRALTGIPNPLWQSGRRWTLA